MEVEENGAAQQVQVLVLVITPFGLWLSFAKVETSTTHQFLLLC